MVAFQSQRDQNRIDLCLFHRMAAAALADIDQPRRGRRQRQHAGPDQPIMQDDLRLGDQPCRFQGQKLRVARTGAHEADPARTMIGLRDMIHAESLLTRPSPIVPARSKHISDEVSS